MKLPNTFDGYRIIMLCREQPFVSRRNSQYYKYDAVQPPTVSDRYQVGRDRAQYNQHNTSVFLFDDFYVL